MSDDALTRAARRNSDLWRGRIAAGISSARKRAGLTQQQLGDVVGVGPQAISEIETAKVVPDYATLESIADVLQVTLDDLVARIAPESASEGGTESLGIWQLLARLNDRQAALAESVGEIDERIQKLENPDKAKDVHLRRNA